MTFPKRFRLPNRHLMRSHHLLLGFGVKMLISSEYVAGLARNYTYDFPMCPSLATLNNDRPVLKMPFLFLHAPLEKSKSQCSMGEVLRFMTP
mmetsp:Transcript_96629/g.171844  ORF Transcript_96629/g.171844 Transcript_96629/m.171844 type:complete len:92 (-) Transcript_96629:71-346(-)